jgi:hypothetical protein
VLTQEQKAKIMGRPARPDEPRNDPYGERVYLGWRWDDYNWNNVWSFAHRDTALFDPIDVLDVLWAVDGENEDSSWVAVLRLKDGRLGYISAGCAYTGWDVGGSGDSAVTETLAAMWWGTCTEDDRSRIRESGQFCGHDDCLADEEIAEACMRGKRGATQ